MGEPHGRKLHAVFPEASAKPRWSCFFICKVRITELILLGCYEYYIKIFVKCLV